MVRPLTGFGPSSETPSGAAFPPCRRPRSSVGFRAPPLRFHTPSAFEDQRIGKCFRTTRPGLPTKRLPTSASCRPSWVSSSLTPAALFHAAAAHGVSTLQSFSLRANSSRLVTWRSPLGVSPGSRRNPAAPSGVFVRPQSVSALGVLHPLADRCSPGFRRLHGFPALRDGFVSQRIIRS